MRGCLGGGIRYVHELYIRPVCILCLLGIIVYHLACI